jgi:nitroreductase/NAD-dependent dihydropyrimidine dehydrogenase PreA subunit
MKTKFIKEINISKCSDCGICADLCPSENIDLEAKSFINETCLECCHCMSVCPVSAITFNGNITKNIKNKVSSSDFRDLALSRRSIRNYLDKEIPKEKLMEIADFLSFSPTGTNSQKVNITILSSKEKVQLLTKKIMKFYITLSKFAVILSPLMYILIGIKKTKRILKFRKNLQRYIDGKDILSYNAPALFIFHVPKSASTPDQDCSIASTLGVHYAETLGFGTCFNGFIVYAFALNKSLKKDLNIPKDHKVYSTFLLGYPKYSFKREVLRKKINVNLI